MIIRRLFILLTPIIGVAVLSACNETSKSSNTISVSIEPLKYITEQIAGNDFQINVLVPSGASPETFEPTPAQMIQVANSLYYIDIGLLDFEINLQKSITKNMPNVKLIELKKGIILISGHYHGKEAEDTHDHVDIDNRHQDSLNEPTDNSAHNHSGTDPHIWTTPKNLKIMARTVCDALMQQYPDSIKYISNYNLFTNKMDSLNLEIKRMIDSRNLSFLIYHPALGYFASEYELTQLSIEDEGKEPSAQHISNLIELTKSKGIKYILYQKQFSKNTVEALARETNIQAEAIDPLAYDIPYNLLEICKLITSQKQ